VNTAFAMLAVNVVQCGTDSLIEAENAQAEFFGLERTKAIFREHASETPQAIIDALIDGLKLFCQTSSFMDDISLMVFQWR
jgi:serine phosphatase RsbU (regulator of sigma subunit)